MPKLYDLDQDNPYGVASADFPITGYDRPQLAFANLLRSDVDGMTRAMLSPSTLTPTQIKTVRDTLLRGKHPNPILKTITDIATNPLVIAGLVVGLWKFPLGTTEPLLALRRGLLPKAVAMDSLFAGMHGAMMNLRTHPGLFEKLNAVYEATAAFKLKYWERANKIFLDAGPMSKVERLAVAARMDGLQNADHSMVKLLGNEPEIIALMGGKNVPVAAGLQGKMRKEVVGAADKMRDLQDDVWKWATSNPEAEKRIHDAVEKKGLVSGGRIDSHFPRSVKFNRYENDYHRGVSGVQSRNYVHDEDYTKVSGAYVERPDYSMGNLDNLLEMEKAGMIPLGYNKAARAVLNRWSGEAASTVERVWNEVKVIGTDEGAHRAMFAQRMTEYSEKSNMNFVARLGKPEKAKSTLDAMALSLQQARFGGQEAIKKEFQSIGRVLAEPGQYSLDPHEALGRYVSTVADTHAWHGTGYGKEIEAIVKRKGEFDKDPWAKSYVEDGLIPHVRGVMTDKQLARSLNATVHKEKIYNWLGSHPMIDSVIGPENKKWLMNYYKDSKFFSSLDSMSSAAASNFYLSTLGGNVSSASANSLQPILTTVNTVGVRGLWYGLKGFAGQEGMLSRMSRYVGGLAKGIDKDEAFKAAFPDFVEDLGTASKAISTQLAIETEQSGALSVGAKTVWGKVKDAMMLPFSTSETHNKLLAYYSGKNTHLFHNATKLAEASAEGRAALLKEAGEVGQTLNMVSNFTGGPLGVPKALMNWSPVARQFMHFPLRMMGALHGSLRMGMDPSKLDWGFIGRATAGSTAAYLTARDLLGVDISKGLMTGALPIPEYEKSPFYPFPFVPPIAQMAGTAAMGLLKGDTSQLAGAAAMAVPGGIALSRAYRTLSPRYADYTNPTPEGRVPLYDHNKSLIGTLSPMELTLRSMGLRPTSVSAEAGAAKWLVSQRDRIRGYRRDFTQAITDNETQKADKIKAEFQKVYPELGELQIKKSDLKAIENRKQISRLSRIERGIPTAYRPIFSQVIGEAGLGRMVEDIEQGGPDSVQGYYASFQ
jgi:hypothetical protein